MSQVKRAQKEEEFATNGKKIKPCIKKRISIWKLAQTILDSLPEGEKNLTPINTAYTIQKSWAPNSVHLWPFRTGLFTYWS